LLYIVTEDKNILEKTAPFVEELSIAYARSTKELIDYRIVSNSDSILVANNEKVNKMLTRRFPTGVQFLTLTNDSVGEDLSPALLFVKVLGHPRYGAYLDRQDEIIKPSTLVTNENVAIDSASAVKQESDSISLSTSESEVSSSESVSASASEILSESEKVEDKPVIKEPVVTKEEVYEEIDLKPRRKHLVDHDVDGEFEQLVSKGKPGKGKIKYLVTFEDGKEVERKRVGRVEVIVQPEPDKYIVSEETDKKVPKNLKVFNKKESKPSSKDKALDNPKNRINNRNNKSSNKVTPSKSNKSDSNNEDVVSEPAKVKKLGDSLTNNSTKDGKTFSIRKKSVLSDNLTPINESESDVTFVDEPASNGNSEPQFQFVDSISDNSMEEPKFADVETPVFADEVESGSSNPFNKVPAGFAKIAGDV
jgi:hypothetical protein